MASSEPQPHQPLHVAIIMDGNGRWARKRGRPRVHGHRAGAEAVRRTVEAAPELGIGTLTLYAFSADNWKRPALEISTLMDLLERYLDEETPGCVKNGVRLDLIGRRDRLAPGVIAAAERAEAATRTGRKLHLRIAVDYSSRQAILRAARAAAAERDVDEGRFSRLLDEVSHSAPAPEVDVVVRTSGEKRLSDFLLWECAYAELVFTERLWPDFGEDDLRAALEEFATRQRRFGGLLPARRPGRATPAG